MAKDQPTTLDEWRGWTVKQMKAECKNRGLDQTGKKDNLCERLFTATRGEQPGAAASRFQLTRTKNDDLRTKCDRLGIDNTGNKAALVQRILDHNAGVAADPAAVSAVPAATAAAAADDAAAEDGAASPQQLVPRAQYQDLKLKIRNLRRGNPAWFEELFDWFEVYLEQDVDGPGLPSPPESPKDEPLVTGEPRGRPTTSQQEGPVPRDPGEGPSNSGTQRQSSPVSKEAGTPRGTKRVSPFPEGGARKRQRSAEQDAASSRVPSETHSQVYGPLETSASTFFGPVCRYDKDTSPIRLMYDKDSGSRPFPQGWLRVEGNDEVVRATMAGIMARCGGLPAEQLRSTWLEPTVSSTPYPADKAHAALTGQPVKIRMFYTKPVTPPDGASRDTGVEDPELAKKAVGMQSWVEGVQEGLEKGEAGGEVVQEEEGGERVQEELEKGKEGGEEGEDVAAKAA